MTCSSLEVTAHILNARVPRMKKCITIRAYMHMFLYVDNGHPVAVLSSRVSNRTTLFVWEAEMLLPRHTAGLEMPLARWEILASSPST